jgi:flagellar hook-basal body complex protein FliE
MAIAPVAFSGLTPPLTPPAGADSAGGAATGGESFGGIMERLLGNAAGSHQNAEASLRSLAVGETSNLHSVMLNMAQADLSFRLVLEIRNRLTQAYQEIMKMQV